MSRTNPKTVCISTQPSAMGGGIGREVDLIAASLIDSGCEVTVATPENLRKDLFYNEDYIPFGDKVSAKSLTVRTFFPIYIASYLLYGFAMRRKLPDSDVNLVIGSSALEAAPFLFSRKKYTCFVATTFWDEWRSVMKLTDLRRPLSWTLRVLNTVMFPLNWILERACYRNAHGIIAVSKHSAANIRQAFSVRNVVVVNPPVDEKCFGDFPREREGRYIFSVGRLDPRKGLAVLLMAFAESNYTGDLVIAGAGPELERLKLKAQELGIGDRVEFAGFVSDDKMYSLMQHAEVFVLTSEQEGFGITVLESMALRTPVISTRCGGPEDVVIDGVTGFMAKVGDFEMIGKLISKATSGDVQEIVENAYRVAERLKPAKVVERILEIDMGRPSAKVAERQ